MRPKRTADLRNKAEKIVGSERGERDTVSALGRAAMVEAIAVDLGAAADRAVIAEDRIVKLEAQTQVLTDAIVAIGEAVATVVDAKPHKDTTSDLTPAVPPVPCEACQDMQVRFLTTPVRIYYHCPACKHDWNVPNPAHGHKPLPTVAGDIVISHSAAVPTEHSVWHVTQDGEQSPNHLAYMSCAIGESEAIKLARLMVRDSHRGAIYVIEMESLVWTKLSD
ncbi:MAG: hypothetical protein ABIX28_11330 [Vicinamibacterales bacterium]